MTTPSKPQVRTPPDGRGADLSVCETYRYHLWREWDDALPRVAFVMLNPSTADAEVDDPTIRRCIGFAKAWGYGALDVVNLMAYRATDPRALRRAHDPVGPRNHAAIRFACSRAAEVVAAWGAVPHFYDEAKAVEMVVTYERPLRAIRLTKNGWPSHPLYLPADLRPVEFRPKFEPEPEPAPPPRPRSPIEIMVDRACGLEPKP